MDNKSYYSIKNMPPELAKAIRVAAALEDVHIWKYCVKALEAAVKKSGVVIEPNKEE